ncbi:Glycoside hydrolase [Aspergillus ustus]|uniref:Glycoside hydrolase n=1 Tax=Aspergillus ustus TaxID=40382 RepID=A0A0C1E2K2_ASPUT|nr:Glycoside hydrolase [Aspergillus ustus]
MRTATLASLFIFSFILLSPAPAAAKPAQNSTYTNPILPGFHPDPSCIFVPEWDNTFFCATSSFNAFPGIPIHASKDLQNWRLIANVLNRESQLPELATVNSSTGGIWAPTLRYKNGTFWLVTTLVYDDYAQNDSSRWDNIVFKSSNPYDQSTWSNPIHFDFNGYDTSPFWDTDGQVYMVGSHAWQVYPSIQIARINLHTGATGDWTTLWTGTGGLAPEGPHIYYKDDMYYLMIAEGGTGLDHMETIARSSHLMGPYEANPANPVLTAANTTRFFTTVGHADLFQDASDNWWAVALATRSDASSAYHPMGRETVLTPVTWKRGDWPVLDPVEGEMEGWPLPKQSLNVKGDGPWISDGDDIDFAPGSSLPRHLTYWRIPSPDSYTISPNDHPYTLQLDPSWANLTGLNAKSAPASGVSFLGRRQQDTLFTFSVDLSYTPRSSNEEAGVTVFLQQNKHVDLGIVRLSDNKPYLRVRGISTGADAVPLPSYEAALPSGWAGQPLHLEIQALNFTHYSLSAGPASARSEMQTLAYPVNSALSWGFTGTSVGIYATSNGGDGTTPAYFSNWSYIPQGQYVN